MTFDLCMRVFNNVISVILDSIYIYALDKPGIEDNSLTL